MKKDIKLSLLLMGVLLVLNLTGFAQPGPPTTGGGPPTGCWPPSSCIPIDGGLGFLIAAGVVYGARRVYDTKKS